MTDKTFAAYTAAPAAPAAPFPHVSDRMPELKSIDVPNTVLMQTLYRACTMRRPHGSMAEAKFVGWLCNRLPVARIDAAGNIHVDLRRTDAHRTMFTSHTDSVHRQGGPNTVHRDRTNPKSIKWRAGRDAALGADDGAGIALMAHMIEAGVAGYYVFFRGEEVGGIGSKWLAENMSFLKDDFDRCVSFDRAGYSDIITHQFGGRCCSDAFAEALASALTDDAMTTVYSPDPTGSFTDSANFTDLIGECTNVSVGYGDQHGDREWQDVSYLPLLAARLTTVAWDALPAVRKPGEEEVTDVLDFNFAKGTNLPLHEIVLYALAAAMDGFYRDLDDMVCEWLNPEDSWALSHKIHCRDAGDERIEQMMDGLANETMTAEEILDELGALARVN